MTLLSKEQKRDLRPYYKYSTMKEKYSLYDVVNIAYLDIECTNLAANFGYILSWTMRIRNMDTNRTKEYYALIDKSDIDRAVRNGEVTMDKRVLEELLKTIKNELVKKEGDPLLVGQYFHGWNKMDIPYIRTRAAICKLDDMLPSHKQVRFGDCWSMAHKLHKLNSYRLDSIAEIWEDIDIKKTAVDKRSWQLAALGHKKSLGYVLDHNRKDVVLTESVHKKLERFVPIPSGYV